MTAQHLNKRQQEILAYIGAHSGCTKEAIRKDLAEKHVSSPVTTWKEIKNLEDLKLVRIEKEHPNSQTCKLFLTQDQFSLSNQTPREVQQYLRSYYAIELKIDQLRQQQLELETKFNLVAKGKGLKVRVQGSGYFTLN